MTLVTAAPRKKPFGGKGKPFKSGAEWNGNAAGRPRKLLEPPPAPPPPPPDIKALARDRSAEALETLTEVMRDKSAGATTRVAAANAILDRGYGKPQQVIEATLTAFDQMTDDELLALLTGSRLKTIEGEVIEATSVDREADPEDE